MAQYAQDRAKQRQAEDISSLISVFMTIAAIIYMFVMGMYYGDDRPDMWLIVPPIALLVGAMWFIVKPAKVEY